MDKFIYMYSRYDQATVPALSYPKASGYLLAQGPGSSKGQNRNRLLVSLTWLVVVVVVEVEVVVVVVYVLVSMTWSTAEMSAPDRSRSAVIEYRPVESATNKQVDPFYKKCM